MGDFTIENRMPGLEREIFISVADEIAKKSFQEYENAVMEFDAIYLSYRMKLLGRPGITDNLIRGPFDGYTIFRNRLDGDRVDHTPEIIDKTFRACKDRAEDLKDRFEESMIYARIYNDNLYIDVKVIWNHGPANCRNPWENTSGSRSIFRYGVWKEVNFSEFRSLDCMMHGQEHPPKASAREKLCIQSTPSES